jgi:hypothetical protein
LRNCDHDHRELENVMTLSAGVLLAAAEGGGGGGGEPWWAWAAFLTGIVIMLLIDLKVVMRE